VYLLLLRRRRRLSIILFIPQVLLNAGTDLLSFSSILFSIYPPLFVALVIYAVGGTALSLQLGRPLVGLNFTQESREADFRYGLVRVRENAESVAFYGGEDVEGVLLRERLGRAMLNLTSLIDTSRNLSFFTSFYRYLIILLPAAVVAPLYFNGEIEFGVINQSSSAFSHILNDVSLVIYQIEALAGFSAVVDRLGEFTEAIDFKPQEQITITTKAGGGSGRDPDTSTRPTHDPLLSVEQLTVLPPRSPGATYTESMDPDVAAPTLTNALSPSTPLFQDLSFQVKAGESLLIMGPSGAGKTSLLRSLAGLWAQGRGIIHLGGDMVNAKRLQPREGSDHVAGGTSVGSIMFVPQRPYLLLGTLRDQLLYPAWGHAYVDPMKTESESRVMTNSGDEADATGGSRGSGGSSGSGGRGQRPTDARMIDMVERVGLGGLFERYGGANEALGKVEDWSGILSLGEQQRLAFARVLLAQPDLVLMDESTSALDAANEAKMYQALASQGITYVSVGHRASLKKYHGRLLHLGGGDGNGWRLEEIDATI